MKLIWKILGAGWLTGSVLLLGGLSPAQDQPEQATPQVQQQSPSTADLESQPNTTNYQRARRRGFPRPTAQTPTPDPSANADPPAAAFQPNNSPQPNSDFQPPASNTPTAPPAPANTGNRSRSTQSGSSTPSFMQPAPGFIGPPAPLPQTLEQMAPTPPKIVYQNGLLSVESVNSRLIDVLNGIRAKAGIQFEGMQGFQDRVAGKFGPAPADQVLTSLLQGTHLDYVIIGLPENPSLVQRVILTPNSNAAATGVPGASQPHQEANGDEDDNADDSAETPEQTQSPEQAQQPVPRNSASPKTPEQLLEELKQMQQRSQQQNQQQNPPQAPLKPGVPR